MIWCSARFAPSAAIGSGSPTSRTSRRGFANLALVIDVFSRRIVGCRVSKSMRTDLALDSMELLGNSSPAEYQVQSLKAHTSNLVEVGINQLSIRRTLGNSGGSWD